MKKIIVTIIAVFGIATTAAATTTPITSGSIAYPDNGDFSEVAGTLTLEEADIDYLGNGLAVLHFDSHVVRNAAGGIVSRGGEGKAIASQNATGGIDSILVAPPDGSTSGCTLNLDFYDWCLSNIVADPGVSCSEPDCQDLFDFCEDESWSGC